MLWPVYFKETIVENHSPMGIRATRNLVTFTSTSFNTTERLPNFIHPGCFGEDLAIWLTDQLRFRDIRTYQEPTQRDYGWYLLFGSGLTVHLLTLTFISFDNLGRGEWLGCVERRTFVSAILGKRLRMPEDTAVEVIHRILSASSMIQNIKWYTQDELETKYKSVPHFLPFP